MVSMPKDEPGWKSPALAPMKALTWSAVKADPPTRKASVPPGFTVIVELAGRAPAFAYSSTPPLMVVGPV